MSRERTRNLYSFALWLLFAAILVGSLGTGLGTYLGFLTAAWLQ